MASISTDHPIAYFCAEYGYNAKLPLYAGGLGILAGDTLKAAADMQLPMTAVGILYRGNESRQRITAEGEQREERHDFDPLAEGLEHVYVDELPLFVRVRLSTLTLWLRVWKQRFSDTVTLYLLDADTDQNPASERNTTHPLYYGAEEEMIQQQFILGIGGVKLLQALGIHPCFYHLNEGRPAFLHWQLIRMFMSEHGMGYEEAKAEAIKRTVYVNHTLVKAGNQSYSIHPIRNYAEYYADKIGISLDDLLRDGQDGDPDRFSLTRFALNTASKASAVSQIHSTFCKETWPEYQWVSVTNGVHMGTWQAESVRKANSNQELILAHQEEKRKLTNFVAERSGYGYDPRRLVLTWARRIAGYKQLDQLFADIERLRRILKDSQRPVQLLVAGKAHFGDSSGKALIKEVITHMGRELSGHAIFVPNYDLDVARMLVRGSDVWINTPIFGQEASGTSGMKAVANAVLQLSVADGWMAEVDIQSIGWQLNHDHLSESFYELLEEKIIPLYYGQDEPGTDPDWLAKMQGALTLSQRFSAKRMLEEYVSKLYDCPEQLSEFQSTQG